MRSNIGFIYFMTERDLFGYPCGPYVKIGLVKGNDDGRSSFERRKEHQTGNPREIIIEAEVETRAQVSTLESLIHQRLAKYRIHGEWFNYGEDGIQPYLELTKKINEDLEGQIKDNLLINQYAIIEDNGEELNPSSEAKDIHNELLEAKKEITKIKNEKDLGSNSVLKQYQIKRLTRTGGKVFGIHLLNKISMTENKFLKNARKSFLMYLNQSPFLRKALIKTGLGK